jgi:hypothetical protein
MNIDDVVAKREPEPGRKPWSEITDDEFMAAVRLAYETVTTAAGGWRKEWVQSGDVQDALVNPREPLSPNMRRGLGLMVPYGDGSPPSGAITRRLKKLAEAGEIEAVPLVRPRGKPAGFGYVVRS